MSTGISILGSQVLFGLHPAATPPPIDPPCCSFCVGSRLRQYKAQLSSCRGGTKTRKGQGGIHACLNCRNALESLGRAGAVYPARFFSRPRSPSHGRSVTPRQPRTSFLGGKGGICDGENVNGFLGRGPTAGPGPATDRPAIPVLGAAGSGRWSRGLRGADGWQ